MDARVIIAEVKEATEELRSAVEAEAEEEEEDEETPWFVSLFSFASSAAGGFLMVMLFASGCGVNDATKESAWRIRTNGSEFEVQKRCWPFWYKIDACSELRDAMALVERRMDIAREEKVSKGSKWRTVKAREMEAVSTRLIFGPTFFQANWGTLTNAMVFTNTFSLKTNLLRWAKCDDPNCDICHPKPKVSKKGWMTI
jgi:hypothetical protein